MWVVVGAAAIGAIGAGVAANQQKNASKKATAAQSASAANQLSAEREMFDLSRGDYAPYRDIGTSIAPTFLAAVRGQRPNVANLYNGPPPAYGNDGRPQQIGGNALNALATTAQPTTSGLTPLPGTPQAQEQTPTPTGATWGDNMKPVAATPYFSGINQGLIDYLKTIPKTSPGTQTPTTPSAPTTPANPLAGTVADQSLVDQSALPDYGIPQGYRQRMEGISTANPTGQNALNAIQGMDPTLTASREQLAKLKDMNTNVGYRSVDPNVSFNRGAIDKNIGDLSKLSTKIDLSNLKDSPLYQAMLADTNRTLNRKYAARGDLFSSSADDTMARNNLQVLQAEYDRQANDYGREAGKLSTLAGLNTNVSAQQLAADNASRNRDMELASQQYQASLGNQARAYGQVSDLYNMNNQLDQAEWARRYGQATDTFTMGNTLDNQRYTRDYGKYGDLYNLSTNEANSQYQKLLDAMNLGRGAAAGSAGAAQTTGSNLASIYQNQGNALSNLALNQGNNNASFASGLGALPMNALNAYQSYQQYKAPTASTTYQPTGTAYPSYSAWLK